MMKQISRTRMGVVVEELERRRLLSGAGPLVRRHLIPRFHHGSIVRSWRYPTHTVSPDVLLGQFAGMSTPSPNTPIGYDPSGSVSLTFTKNAIGDLSGILHLVGFAFSLG